jgi:GNAT superfamily N-acetyltransferase
MSALTFRYEVEPADVSRIAAMVEVTGFFRPDEVAVAVELVEARLTRGDASEYFFVFAMQGDDTIGYACYGPIGCTIGSIDLYWIVVDPAAQGRGVGRGLVTEVERLCRTQGSRKIYIETSDKPQYAPTREFYLRCGYKIDALQKDFYDDGDDKLVLVKDLRSTRL